ncbi:hypothetical protein DH2020_033094 [Rehmannia glutinosa]|uniref:CRAL-TRIO domain-containing protein n=1 Tax=Rehmannia glutinosa TaxID=99300 RepID=A0ABR0VFN6_REHGL
MSTSLPPLSTSLPPLSTPIMPVLSHSPRPRVSIPIPRPLPSPIRAPLRHSWYPVHERLSDLPSPPTSLDPGSGQWQPPRHIRSPFGDPRSRKPPVREGVYPLLKDESSDLPLSDENEKKHAKEFEKEEFSPPISNGDEKKNANEFEKNNDFSPSDGNKKEYMMECEKSDFLLPLSDENENENENDEFSSIENGLLSNLTEHEKKALIELRSKLEEAISTNNLFKEETNKENPQIEKSPKEDDKEEESKKVLEENEKQANSIEINKDISLWGVPLLPSKGDKGLDVLLIKFLKARDFKANDTFEMLKSTLEWRKENKIDSILDEDLGNDYDCVAFMRGLDREGHPICYNVYGVFADEEMYNKTFGTEVSREKFLRWRIQMLEKEILKLDFRHGGISTLLQINDLKNAPGPSRRDLRHATKRVVGIFQDNYPEFIARNLFINVPFWYYAFNAILSPFLTQRTKSKFVFSRPARVTETLLKYIAAEEIPVLYGGLRREDDPDFSTQDAASEINVKAGATETIEIPAPEAGNTLIWDLTIIGWDVNYKEEFVPTDEGSYTVIVKKGRKISWQQEPIRNSFKNKEPGKVVITIENSEGLGCAAFRAEGTASGWFHRAATTSRSLQWKDNGPLQFSSNKASWASPNWTTTF